MAYTAPIFGPCPPRFVDIKKDIVNSYPDFQKRVTASWNDLLGELDKVTQEIASQGSQVCVVFSIPFFHVFTQYHCIGQAVPEVLFSDLDKLSEERLSTIRRKGCVVIRNVVDDGEASGWKKELKEYVNSNPVEGRKTQTPPVFVVLNRVQEHLRKTSSFSSSCGYLSQSCRNLFSNPVQVGPNPSSRQGPILMSLLPKFGSIACIILGEKTN